MRLILRLSHSLHSLIWCDTDSDDSSAVNLSTGQTEVQQPFKRLGNKLTTFHKYQEAARILLANERKLQALEYIAEQNAITTTEAEHIVFDGDTTPLGDPFKPKNDGGNGYPTGEKLEAPNATGDDFESSPDPKSQQELNKKEHEKAMNEKKETSRRQSKGRQRS